MDQRPFIRVLFVLLGYATLCGATECYTCTFNGAGDDVCSDPANVTDTVVCSGDCAVKRIVILATSGVQWMFRGCKVEESGCQTAGGVETCVWNCDTDLCNDQDRSVSLPPTETTTPRQTENTTPRQTPHPDSVFCYSCTYTGNPEEALTCVTDPANFTGRNTILCEPNNVCTIFRQDDRGENRVRSFSRGCSPATDFGCTESVYFKTCMSYCCSDLCNHGDGIPQGSTGPACYNTPAPPTNPTNEGGRLQQCPVHLWTLGLSVIGLLGTRLYLTTSGVSFEIAN